jgi:hypothetical protein
MTQSSPHERPNCEEILKDIHLWASNQNEFKFENEMSLYFEIRRK